MGKHVVLLHETDVRHGAFDFGGDEVRGAPWNRWPTLNQTSALAWGPPSVGCRPRPMRLLHAPHRTQCGPSLGTFNIFSQNTHHPIFAAGSPCRWTVCRDKSADAASIHVADEVYHSVVRIHQRNPGFHSVLCVVQIGHGKSDRAKPVALVQEGPVQLNRFAQLAVFVRHQSPSDEVGAGWSGDLDKLLKISSFGVVVELGDEDQPWAQLGRGQGGG